jgi:hypothetical protein
MNLRLGFNEFGDLQLRDANRRTTVLPRLWDFKTVEVFGLEVLILSPSLGRVMLNLEHDASRDVVVNLRFESTESETKRYGHL